MESDFFKNPLILKGETRNLLWDDLLFDSVNGEQESSNLSLGVGTSVLPFFFIFLSIFLEGFCYLFFFTLAYKILSYYLDLVAQVELTSQVSGVPS